VAWVLYDNYRLSLLNGGGVDLDTDTIKLSLHTATYSPSQANHDFFDDATNEVSGTNYTSGGSTLATVTVNLSSGTVKFDADDVVFNQHASGFSNARYAVIYKSTGVAGTSRLICYADLGGDKGNVSGPLTLQMDSGGIFTSP
jgi:hypothetical protein